MLQESTLYKLLLALIHHAYIPCFFPLLIVVLRGNSLWQNAATRAITVSTVCSVIFATIGAILFHQSRNNLPFLHLYTFLEYLILASFYYIVLEGSPYRKIIPWISVLYVLLSIWSTLYYQTIWQVDSLMRGVESGCLLVYCMMFFLTQFGGEEAANDQVERRRSRALFWVNVGYFLYFASNLPLMLFWARLQELSRSANLVVWTVHALIAYLLYALIAFGLWRTPKI